MERRKADAESESLRGSADADLARYTHGLLQLRGYARHVLTPTVLGWPARDIERVLRERMEGQAILDDNACRFVLMTEQRDPREISLA